MLPRVAIALIAVLFALSVEAMAQVRIDGLLATVGDRVLMQSDVRLARDLERVAPGLSDDEARAALVDRMLMVVEVERFQPPDPPPSRVSALLAETRRRVGAERWAEALRRAGVDEDHVRALIEDDLRLDAYLRQRFEALAQPGDDEVRQEVQRRLHSAVPGAAVDSTALEAQVREELRRTHYNDLVAQWVAELRSRATRSS